MLCCFPCYRSHNHNDVRESEMFSVGSRNTAMLDGPEFDTLIHMWEAAITDYVDFEEECIAAMGNILIENLHTLRKNPNHFLLSSLFGKDKSPFVSPEDKKRVQELARKRVMMLQRQGGLGLGTLDTHEDCDLEFFRKTDRVAPETVTNPMVADVNGELSNDPVWNIIRSSYKSRDVSADGIGDPVVAGAIRESIARRASRRVSNSHLDAVPIRESIARRASRRASNMVANSESMRESMSRRSSRRSSKIDSAQIRSSIARRSNNRSRNSSMDVDFDYRAELPQRLSLAGCGGFNSNGDRMDSTTTVLTQAWARRLEEIETPQVAYCFPASDDPVAATEPNDVPASRADVAHEGPQKVSLKPKWPAYLGTVTYHVTKRNDFGQNLPRTLKLTEYHLLNIKARGKGVAITKSYPFVCVQRIWLECTNVVMVQYTDGKQNMFLSPMAPHIVQQLTTRVQIRISLEQTRRPVTGAGSQGSVSRVNMYTQTMSIMIHNIMQAGDGSAGQGADNSGEPASVEPDIGGADDAVLDWTPRMLASDESSVEYQLQKSIQSIIFDGSSPIGNTRNHFLEHFYEKDSTLNDVRTFIDGMYEYLLEHKGVELAKILATSEQERRGLDELVAGGGGATCVSTVLGRKTYNTLCYIIFAVAEESVFLPLEEGICELIPSAFLEEEESYFLLKLHVFAHRMQAKWGIVDESPLNWEAAVFELAGVERNPTPSTRLHALVRTAKAIYTEFNLAVKPKILREAQEKNTTTGGKPPAEPVLSADDLVPIFIYVLSQCYRHIHHPITNRDLLWAVSHPEQLHGEAGYYLTLYESAVEYIIHEPFDLDEGLLAVQDIHRSNGSLSEASDDRASSIASSIIEYGYDVNREGSGTTGRSRSTDTLMRSAKHSVASAKHSVVTLLSGGSVEKDDNLDKSLSRFESGLMKFDATL